MSVSRSVGSSGSVPRNASTASPPRVARNPCEPWTSASITSEKLTRLRYVLSSASPLTYATRAISAQSASSVSNETRWKKSVARPGLNSDSRLGSYEIGIGPLRVDHPFSARHVSRSAAQTQWIHRAAADDKRQHERQSTP